MLNDSKKQKENLSKGTTCTGQNNLSILTGTSLLEVPSDFLEIHYLETSFIMVENLETPNLILSGETFSGEIFLGRNYSSGEVFVSK